MLLKTFLLLVILVQTPVLALNNHLLPKTSEKVKILSQNLVDIVKSSGIREITLYDFTSDSQMPDILKEVANKGGLKDLVINNFNIEGKGTDSSLGIVFIDSLNWVRLNLFLMRNLTYFFLLRI